MPNLSNYKITKIEYTLLCFRRKYDIHNTNLITLENIENVMKIAKLITMNYFITLIKYTINIRENHNRTQNIIKQRNTSTQQKKLLENYRTNKNHNGIAVVRASASYSQLTGCVRAAFFHFTLQNGGMAVLQTPVLGLIVFYIQFTNEFSHSVVSYGME